MNIAVLGAGAWGSALASTFAGQHEVTLWTRDAAFAGELRTHRENLRYLPGHRLPASIAIDADLAGCLSGAALIVAAVPTGALAATLARVEEVPGAGEKPLVWACKGFDASTGELPHRIIARVRTGAAASGVLSGPSFAAEIARGLPAALTLASTDAGFARATAHALHNNRLRVYSSTDVIGVEVGGAAKNVMAIAAGICDGLALGLNARAALVTRGSQVQYRPQVGLAKIAPRMQVSITNTTPTSVDDSTSRSHRRFPVHRLITDAKKAKVRHSIPNQAAGTWTCRMRVTSPIMPSAGEPKSPRYCPYRTSPRPAAPTKSSHLRNKLTSRLLGHPGEQDGGQAPVYRVERQ